MKDYSLGLNETDCNILFRAFDENRDGMIDYDEFLRTIRGPMNDFRKKYVAKAFDKFDRNHHGHVDANDIMGVYSGQKHPDVIQGKKTEQQVLEEFLDTF